MSVSIMTQELLALHISHNQAAMLRFIDQHPLADCAEAFAQLLTEQQLTEQEVCQLLALLPLEKQVALFGYFSLTWQEKLAEQMDAQLLTQLAELMPHDERADLLTQLEPELQQQVLEQMDSEERSDIQRLVAYPEESVGAVMTSDFAVLSADYTVEQAMQKLRSIAKQTETIYQAYVVDEQQRLQGTVSLRDLVISEPSLTVGKIMTRVLIFVRVDEDQNVAAQAISKYDLLALPVVDGQNRLVGIVTYDDAMDVAEEEADRHMHKSAAVDFTGNLKEASVGLMYRKRVFWLVLLVFGNLFSGAGIAHFEDTIHAYVALVFFLPLLIDSGGNAGSQSATLMVRALATGEVIGKDWAKMLGREVMIAGLLGVTMAAAVSMLGLWRGGPEIALVVAITMQIVVIVGSVVGMSLPFVLSKLKFDPASASAPLITTIADAVGVIIYFSVATMILDFPPTV
ncbi:MULTISPECIES: magnesium transporter [Vibrio]|uniref:Magnesium transporter MgtE n=1 Tax=bacterium 19CA03SA04 TaxID=2920698 RepID=A0AAU6SZ53_UNCXX|nr:magnesium transporter [Vibrio sp. A8-1]EKO3591853.1 magnesium transporter [Vibrio metschnikovii]EKO3611074.1 magnesium transporter [Vibrio metschnikovii]EKO3637346.1 magnesium transporter [Vibrio metschnikovii]EKO3675784.1 magnesium transporter [Vibrio metschnikovii]EKO3680887.1 magnesium transporter [Vibrio metschnikovii]